MDQEVDIDPDAEIDPELFIKCRLCIEDKGVYQILPSVQEQILYCFGIQVKRFDRLPQLICKMCKVVLTEFHHTKKTFVENQTKILARLKCLKEPTEYVESEEPVDIIKTQKEPEEAESIVNSRKRSSLSDDEQTVKKKKEKPLETNITTMYVCRYCGQSCDTHGNLKQHLKIHPKIQSKSKKYIKKHLVIPMYKFDNKPNFTGVDQAVALQSSFATLDTGSPDYFIRLEKHNDVQIEDVKSNTKTGICQTDSDSSDKPLGYKAKKRRRIRSSASSTDTLKLDDDYEKSVPSEKPAGAAACDDQVFINIDDSSNDTFSNDVFINKNTDKSKELRVIENIIAMCYNKCTSTIAFSEKKVKVTDLDNSLNRKFLSIGRKIITGKAVPCHGLLKYLEHKNVTINWNPMNSQVIKHFDHVRINTSIRETKNTNNFEGWLAVKENEELKNAVDNDVPKHDQKEFVNSTTNFAPTFGQETTNVDNRAGILNTHLTTLTLVDNDTASNKLLNASPVANPKQLPKKAYDVKPVMKRDLIVFNGDSATIDLDSDEGSSEALSMPVIISAESLAPTETKANKQDPIIKSSESLTPTDNKDKDVSGNLTCKPTTASKNNNGTFRLKCKPVSELMSKPQNISQLGKLLMEPQKMPTNVSLVSSSNAYLVMQPLKVCNAPLTQFQPVSPIALQNKQHKNFQTVTSLENAVQDSNLVAWQPTIKSSQRSLVVQPLPTQPVLQVVPPVVIAASAPAVSAVASSSAAPAPISEPAVAPTPTTTSGVVMNSVYFPNMSTENSIRYFQNILQLHNLELITGLNAELSHDFTSLVKFKLEIRLLGKAVILKVSVYGKKGKFCIKLVQPNQEEINIDALPPHWQLHILNAFKGQVSEKIINCASKISPELHEDAKQFVYLMNSIEEKK